ncbi:hypothetical protein [Metabacillus niabensis]|uniref:hypothetical protein n=1 Tax=Metabacillus niabensis TaxID=324854 RepID=UPI00399F73C6
MKNSKFIITFILIFMATLSLVACSNAKKEVEPLVTEAEKLGEELSKSFKVKDEKLPEIDEKLYKSTTKAISEAKEKINEKVEDKKDKEELLARLDEVEKITNQISTYKVTLSNGENLLEVVKSVNTSLQTGLNLLEPTVVESKINDIEEGLKTFKADYDLLSDNDIKAILEQTYVADANASIENANLIYTASKNVDELKDLINKGNSDLETIKKKDETTTNSINAITINTAKEFLEKERSKFVREYYASQTQKEDVKEVATAIENENATNNTSTNSNSSSGSNNNSKATSKSNKTTSETKSTSKSSSSTKNTAKNNQTASNSTTSNKSNSSSNSKSQSGSTTNKNTNGGTNSGTNNKPSTTKPAEKPIEKPAEKPVEKPKEETPKFGWDSVCKKYGFTSDTDGCYKGIYPVVSGWSGGITIDFTRGGTIDAGVALAKYHGCPASTTAIRNAMAKAKSNTGTDIDENGLRVYSPDGGGLSLSW